MADNNYNNYPYGSYGPYGPYGGYNPSSSLYEHGYYGQFAEAAPIRGTAGYANGLPGAGVDNFKIHIRLKNNVKYAIQKKGILRGTIIGLINFTTEPMAELRYTISKSMNTQAKIDGKISEAQFNYRMIKNEERLLYRKYKVGFINAETYNSTLQKLENQYNIHRL